MSNINEHNALLDEYGERPDRCSNCRFWKPIMSDVDEGGSCHRRAPSGGFEHVVVAAYQATQAREGRTTEYPNQFDFDGTKAFFAAWPITWDTMWCGEFEPATSTTS